MLRMNIEYSLFLPHSLLKPAFTLFNIYGKYSFNVITLVIYFLLYKSD